MSADQDDMNPLEVKMEGNQDQMQNPPMEVAATAAAAALQENTPGQGGGTAQGEDDVVNV